MNKFLYNESIFCHVINDSTLALCMHLNIHWWLTFQMCNEKVLLDFILVLSHNGNNSTLCSVFFYQKIRMCKLSKLSVALLYKQIQSSYSEFIFAFCYEKPSSNTNLQRWNVNTQVMISGVLNKFYWHNKWYVCQMKIHNIKHIVLCPYQSKIIIKICIW